jgi:hypothetical protein
MNKLITIKILGLALLMVFGLTGLQAQDDEKPNSKTRFGIRGGVTIANQTFEDGNLNEDPESKFGVDLAILFKLPLGGGTFALQPELHWMQKGAVLQDINDDDVTATLNYLELPILLRWNFGGSIKLFALGGVSAGYLLGGSFDGGSVTEDIKDVYEDLEFSGHVGVGIGLGPIEVDVRYNAGLSDISNADFNPSKITNSSFGAGVSLFC